MRVLFLAVFVILFPSVLFSQDQTQARKFTVSGFIKEEATGENSIAANVYFQKKNSEEKRKGVVTNAYGFFSITLEQGEYQMTVNYLGFIDFKQNIVLDKNIRLNVSMKEEAVLGKEVEILGEKSDENVTKSEMGVITLEIDKIKSLPSFMGETDILKTIQLLPGVQSTEGNTGFYVRGGGPDQNLVLLDEAVVYNSGHLFGFFSVFNGDAIKNVELFKGNMPAQYGGRLSSVLDVSMKEGNSKGMHAQGGIGIIASRLTIEGPIKLDTSSFLVSARRTYIDIVSKPFQKKDGAFSGSAYYFYDLNTKLNYRLSDNDRLFLSGYFGRDVFMFSNGKSNSTSSAGTFKVSMPWGNATTTLRWNHLISKKHFMNTSAIFSDYKFEFGAEQSGFSFKLMSGIRDWNFKMDFGYFPSVKHNIKYGLNYIYHTFIPNQASAKAGDVEIDLGKVPKLHAHDVAVYFGDDFDITDNIRLNAGLRYSYFMQVGPYERYVKSPITQLVTDTIFYKSGKKVADYGGFEPRTSIRYTLNKKSSVKASFSQNYQYIHLASISSVSLPTDLWIPSTSIIQPQFSTQYAMGYFRNFKDDTYETSLEVYYKDMHNMIEFKEGATPDQNVKDNVDNAFTFGKGWSYGAELFLKKRTGRFTGWIGYTLAWTHRQFDSINLGKKFPPKYDRRHDVSVALTFDYTRQWTFGSVFVFATGNAATLPVSWYFIEGQMIPEYGERNSFRMAPYHRMDVSITYTPERRRAIARQKARWEKKMKKKNIDITEQEVPRTGLRKVESSWVLSVYNVYNRKNPYFIYFENEGNILDGTLKVNAKQVSLFPVLPSITWNFKF
ncbi:MAG: TonB-dependent receptor [Bacteroidetes bacterium]|nr:MAG: TonB-dependent receptor [Bacteroidota bacterium]